MGREESAAQAKEAAKAKEAAAAAKKTVRRPFGGGRERRLQRASACLAAHAALCAQAARDKQWEVGAKDTSADAEAAAKASERAAAAAAKKAQEAAEGGGAPVVKQKAGGVVLPKCKACKKPFDPRKGCPC